MFTLLSRRQLISAVTFLLLLTHLSVEAGLIRNSGRGTTRDSNNIDFLLVSDANVNDFGLMTGFAALERHGFNSGDNALISTPGDCIRSFSDYADREAAIMYDGWVETPCYYQNYEADARLQFEGFGLAFFNQAASVDVIWTISGAGIADIVLGGSVSGSAALLDILMPPELVAGEYHIDMEVVFHSGPNNSFFSSFNSHDLSNVDCAEPTPGDLQCFHPGWSGPQDTLTFNSYYTERLVVLAGTDPLSVSEPAGITLMLLALLGIRRRQI